MVINFGRIKLKFFLLFSACAFFIIGALRKLLFVVPLCVVLVASSDAGTCITQPWGNYVPYAGWNVVRGGNVLQIGSLAAGDCDHNIDRPWITLDGGAINYHTSEGSDYVFFYLDYQDGDLWYTDGKGHAGVWSWYSPIPDPLPWRERYSWIYGWVYLRYFDNTLSFPSVPVGDDFCITINGVINHFPFNRSFMYEDLRQKCLEGVYLRVPEEPFQGWGTVFSCYSRQVVYGQRFGPVWREAVHGVHSDESHGKETVIRHYGRGGYEIKE